MSDTPETDIECFIYEGDYVPASFARKLERERDDARKEIERLKAEREEVGRDAARGHVLLAGMRDELWKLQADKARLDWLANSEVSTRLDVARMTSPCEEGSCFDWRFAIDAAMKGAE